jgi:hypothetical protein
MNIKQVSLRILPLSAYLLLISSSLVVLLLFISLGHYAQPSADDFCMANGVRQLGLINHLWGHYLEWSGRYSGNMLYAIYPLIFDLFDGYQFMPALLILGLYFALAYFLSKLFRVSLRLIPVWFTALCFVSVYLIGLKHTASSLYWMAGALTYQSANILLLITLGLMIELFDRQTRQTHYSTVFISLLAFIIFGIGTNEVNMLTLSAILGITFILQVARGWSILKPWLMLCIVALLCVGVVYFAPGNIVRESTFPLRHDLDRAISGSWKMGWWTLLSWLSNPLIMLATLLSPFAVVSLVKLSVRSFKVSSYLVFALLVFTLAIPVVLQFPAWWAMGGWPPPRTVDAIFFVFITSWFFTTGALTLRLSRSPLVLSVVNNHVYLLAPLRLVLAAGFTLALVTNVQFQRAGLDLLQRAKPFQDYIQQRYTLIDNARAHHQLYLEVPDFQQEYPRSIYFNDIVPNPGDWRNTCYAAYFGLHKIRRAKQ